MRAPVCNPLPCPTATETQHVTAPSPVRLEPVTAPLLLSVRGTPALEQREERRKRLLLGQITAGAQHDHSEAQLVCNRALVEISRAGRAELRPSNTIVRCGSHQLTQQRCARSETSPCIAGTFCIDRGQSRSRSQGLRRCSHKTCNKSRQLHSEPFLPFLTCSHTTGVQDPHFEGAQQSTGMAGGKVIEVASKEDWAAKQSDSKNSGKPVRPCVESAGLQTLGWTLQPTRCASPRRS